MLPAASNNAAIPARPCAPPPTKPPVGATAVTVNVRLTSPPNAFDDTEPDAVSV